MLNPEINNTRPYSSFLYPSPVTGAWRLGNSDDFRSDEALVELLFVLDGKIRFQQKGLGGISLSAGQYNIFYPPFFQTSDRRGKEKSGGTVFAVYFTIPYLQDQIITFPSLSIFLDKIKNGIPDKLCRLHCLADSKMIALIRDVQHCNYNGSLRITYFNLKISNLLTIALTRMSSHSPGNSSEIVLKPQDIEKIRATKEYLLQNMEHPPTLIELARKMGLNDYKLKKGYKQLYGVTLFDDFLHARMQKARDLLLQTNHSIVAIAELTGYKNVSGFAATFKRYFGHTPGSLRSDN